MKEEVYNRLADLGTARESMGAVVEKLIDEHDQTTRPNLAEIIEFWDRFGDKKEQIEGLYGEE